MPRHVADQCSNPPERELGASGVAGRLLVAADVAQLVEHHLAKVRVAGSNPVVRSAELALGFTGGVAERRGTGLQIPLHGFKSRLHLVTRRGRLAQLVSALP